MAELFLGIKLQLGDIEEEMLQESEKRLGPPELEKLLCPHFPQKEHQ